MGNIVDCIINWCNTNQGFTSAALALTALFVSVCAIIISVWLQKKIHSTSIRLQRKFHNTSTLLQRKIHNRDVKLSLQQKVLEIYNAYCDCYRLLMPYDIILGAKVGLILEFNEHNVKILNHRVVIERVLNEAHLFFINDEPMKKLLCELLKDFMLLSECYLDLVQKAKHLSVEAFDKVNKTFPELELKGLYELDKILTHQQAFKMFEVMCTTPEVEKYENDVYIYRNKFKYENFDKLFEKYLIRSEL